MHVHVHVHVHAKTTFIYCTVHVARHSDMLTHSEKISGCAKKSAYISKRERFSRIKVGRTILVRSIPTLTCESMCIITLLLAAIPSVSVFVMERERERERERT